MTQLDQSFGRQVAPVIQEPHMEIRKMSSSKYLTSIQAGTEIFVGAGRLDTDDYYCTIQ
jgi:hypothetical protein